MNIAVSKMVRQGFYWPTFTCYTTCHTIRCTIMDIPNDDFVVLTSQVLFMLRNHGIISDVFNVMIKAEGKRYPPPQDGVWCQNEP